MQENKSDKTDRDKSIKCNQDESTEATNRFDSNKEM